MRSMLLGSAYSFAVPLAAGCCWLAATAAAQTVAHDTIEKAIATVAQPAIEAGRASSGVVVAVQAGEIIFAKGYGVADRETGAPADIECTLYPLGSITKLFTWVACMQQVELGRLTLDTDINAYLDGWRIPDEDLPPITLRHLMTHTAGFEDVLIGLWTHDATQLQPLRAILIDKLPARVRAPGEIAAYSNFGAALAGHIAAATAGKEWESLLHEQIFLPLEMSRSSAEQPLPAALATARAKAYLGRGVAPFEFLPLRPAGAAHSTAGDMAKFMVALLDPHLAGDSLGLATGAVSDMLSRQFANHPQLRGLGLGFFEMSDVPGEVMGHTGDSMYYHSSLALAPERRLGVFAAFAGAESTASARGVVRALIELYVKPGEQEGRGEGEAVSFDTRDWSGTYGTNRRGYHDVTALSVLFDNVRIELTPEVIRAARGTQALNTYDCAGDGVWRDRDSAEKLGLVARNGNKYLVLNSNPLLAYERLPWYRIPALTWTWLGIAAAVAFASLIFLPISAAVRRFRKADAPPIEVRLLSLTLWATAVLTLAALTGVVVALADPMRIALGLPPALMAATWAARGALLSSISAFALFVSAIRQGTCSPLRFMIYVIAWSGSVFALAWLFLWNVV